MWIKAKDISGSFPCGPVATTPCSQCRGSGFHPWQENQILHAATKYPTTKTQCVCAKSLQSHLTLCDPMLQPTKLFCPWDFPGKNTEVGFISFSRDYKQVFCFQLLTHDSINHQPLGACGTYVLSLSLMLGSVIDTLFYSHVDAINQGVSTYQ